MQKFLFGAYWDARRESVEACAESANRLFLALADIDPRLGEWYAKARSRKDALERRFNHLTRDVIIGLLLKGRNRRDIGGEIIEDLGFGLSVWNGAEKEEDEASLSIHCGCYNQRIRNRVIIDLPSLNLESGWAANASVLLGTVAALWRPNWAGIMSKQAMRKRVFNADTPFVDWMLYVPRPIGALPPPARVETVNEMGTTIIVQPLPPAEDDTAAQAHIQDIGRILAASTKAA